MHVKKFKLRYTQWHDTQISVRWITSVTSLCIVVGPAIVPWKQRKYCPIHIMLYQAIYLFNGVENIAVFDCKAWKWIPAGRAEEEEWKPSNPVRMLLHKGQGDPMSKNCVVGVGWKHQQLSPFSPVHIRALVK